MNIRADEVYKIAKKIFGKYVYSTGVHLQKSNPEGVQ
jgi:hypothetical protein